MLRLEARVSCPLCKEVLKRAVKIPQGFLQCHAVRFGQPCSFLALLEISEQFACLDVSQRIVIRLPFVATHREEVVEYETCTAQRAIDEVFLCSVRIDAELIAKRVRFHFSHFLCDVFWLSIYCLTIPSGAPPTVEQK